MYVDLPTIGKMGAVASRAMASPSRIASLVNSHPMTPAELDNLKSRVGVADKRKN
jgi:hypothetical protein